MIKHTYLIGKRAACDLRTKGWLSPGIAAEVIRRGADYVVYPMKRGKVAINGRDIYQPTKLIDGDYLSVRNLSMQYFARGETDNAGRS